MKNNKIIQLLHFISHLRWVFLIWLLGLLIFIFFFHPNDPIQKTGQVLYICGIMMGLASLSDVTKISKKQIKELSNPGNVNKQFFALIAAVSILVLISLLFFAQPLIHPSAEKNLIAAFTKLGFDCLVVMLGIFCLLKQLTEKVNYVKSLTNNTEKLEKTEETTLQHE